MPKFSLERIINGNRDVIFDVFSNFENYEKSFPTHIPTVRVRSIRDNVAVVEQHLFLGSKELVIMAKHVTEFPIHEIFVIGGDLKGSHIREEFIELDGKTRILVDVDLKLHGTMRLYGSYNEKYSKILDAFCEMCSV